MEEKNGWYGASVGSDCFLTFVAALPLPLPPVPGASIFKSDTLLSLSMLEALRRCRDAGPGGYSPDAAFAETTQMPVTGVQQACLPLASKVKRPANHFVELRKSQV